MAGPPGFAKKPIQLIFFSDLIRGYLFIGQVLAIKDVRSRLL